MKACASRPLEHLIQAALIPLGGLVSDLFGKSTADSLAASTSVQHATDGSATVPAMFVAASELCWLGLWACQGCA